MKQRRAGRGAWWTTLALLLFAAVVGCNTVGPASLQSGRIAHNGAIIATTDQQTLDMIVRIRYGEMPGLLSVATVTANVSIRASAGLQAGVGSDSSFAGNLVPISGGVVYEENPTISYVPLEGEKYIRQLLSPLPIDLVLLLSKASMKLGQILIPLVSDINGIHNPTFLLGPKDKPNPHFGRVVHQFEELHQARVLDFAIDAAKKQPVVVISR
jgi:hypothetical protein